MSIEAHNYVIKLKVGNVTAKFVLDRLAERADERFTCFPSIGLMAAELEVSDRTVQRALSLLRDLSLVSDRVNKRPDGSQTTNRYQLHGPWDDYAGTGVPFPEIVTPKQARAEMWAQRPAEGEFREGTAAAVALAGDEAAAKDAVLRAAEAMAYTEAASRSKSARGRKAAAARRVPAEGPGGHGGDVSAAREGVTPMSPGGMTDVSPAPVTPVSPLEPSAPTHNSEDAQARSAGDARRASSGSSACEGEGGFAASGKTSPSPTPNDDTRGPARDPKGSSKKAAHTREQLDVARRVRALFPAELLDNDLPDVPTLSSAILTGMGEGRTVEQMGERIWYRWSNHGFADQWAEHGRFEKPVGVAVALVRPLRRGDRFACPDLRCENGASLDTGEVCVKCEMRIADWKAERARQYGQERSTGANTAPVGAGSPDTALPPQRAARPSPVPRTERDWRAQAAAEEEARRKTECDGLGGMCGNNLAPGQTFCRSCAEDAAEQHLENAGAPAPF